MRSRSSRRPTTRWSRRASTRISFAVTYRSGARSWSPPSSRASRSRSSTTRFSIGLSRELPVGPSAEAEKGGSMAHSDDPSHREGRYDRSELLRRAGAGAVSVGVAGSGFGQAFYGPLRFKGRWLKGDLTLITWAHFVPAFDVWLDKTWLPQWGQQNDVQVKVDHILNTLLPARAQAEVAAKSGHDIFFDLAPRPQYEDSVINHNEIVQEVQRKVGKIGRIAHRATYNPKTKKYFAFSDNYVPDPVVWRHDIWTGIGMSPNTWDSVRKAAPKLKGVGHPLGIGQSAELDSNMALCSFLMCFGSFVQTANHQATTTSKPAVATLR